MNIHSLSEDSFLAQPLPKEPPTFADEVNMTVPLLRYDGGKAIEQLGFPQTLKPKAGTEAVE